MDSSGEYCDPVTCREANGLPLMRGAPGGVEGRCEPTTAIPYKDRARELCRVLGRRLGCPPMPFMPETQWVHEDFVQLPEGDCIWCICSQAINSYHIVQNVESGVRFKVGTACIKRYSTETLHQAARTALALHRRASCQAEGCTAKIDRRTKLGRRGVCSHSCAILLEQATWRSCAGCADKLDPADYPDWKTHCVGCYCDLPEPADLRVPFREKDEAKAQGARWMPQRKVWVVPPTLADNARQQLLARWG
jgi:hypothetical protein